MSVANVIPLFPGREPVMHEPKNPAHLPCPDLSCHSLNKEQKSRGLENLAKVRAKLKEGALKPLREEGKALQAKGKETEDVDEQLKIKQQLKKLQSQAEQVNLRWS